jgi:hypothetical protein
LPASSLRRTITMRISPYVELEQSKLIYLRTSVIEVMQRFQDFPCAVSV